MLSTKSLAELTENDEIDDFGDDFIADMERINAENDEIDDFGDDFVADCKALGILK